VLLVSDEAETLKLTQSKGGMNQGRDGPIKGTLRPSFIVPKVGCVGECLPWSHHSRRAIYIELGAALRATRFEHVHNVNQEQRNLSGDKSHPSGCRWSARVSQKHVTMRSG
jgi:hypothetical protein